MDLLVAVSLSQVAELYRARGQYALAEPLFERALAIRDRLLGDDDADLAKSLADLAELYYVQGRYAAAEPLYERAIAIKEDEPEFYELRILVAQGLGQSADAQRWVAKLHALRARPDPEHPAIHDTGNPP